MMHVYMHMHYTPRTNITYHKSQMQQATGTICLFNLDKNKTNNYKNAWQLQPLQPPARQQLPVKVTRLARLMLSGWVRQEPFLRIALSRALLYLPSSFCSYTELSCASACASAFRQIAPVTPFSVLGYICQSCCRACDRRHWRHQPDHSAPVSPS